ncbi:tetratricopeptide repeat protein [Pseudomonas sp. F1_0610]|uniref:tetratricopeptide repeat protein n=1 Tax=Pseudomonas sp. F1_0610 TaxID=3114284 RepID=UPI0039C282E1
MIKKLIMSLLISSSFLTSAIAGSYQPANFEKIISQTSSNNQFNIQEYQAAIINIGKYAQNYPTKFDDEADKKAATQDAFKLLKIAQIIVKEKDNNPHVLQLSMQMARLGHNLDIKGAAEMAVDYSQRYITEHPESAAGYLFLGVFLLDSGKPQNAQPLLEKALALGDKRAYWSLGMFYLYKGDKENAVKHFKRYQAAVPEDQTTERILEAIASGKIEFKSEGIK